jgi:hypothetical protein
MRAAGNSHIPPGRVEQVLAMTTVPDSIVYELLDDDIPRLVGTISDVFPNLAGPLPIAVDPSIELTSIRAFVAG